MEPQLFKLGFFFLLERRVRLTPRVFENPVSNETGFFVFCVSDGSGNPLWSDAQQRL
jgi:hypothetical protein